MDVSSLLIPLLLTAAALWALGRRLDVYDALTAGAAEGLTVLLRIVPSLIALLTAVYMFRASGALDLLTELLAPVLVGLFIDTPATVAYGASFLLIMVLAMPMMAVCYPMITQFQAMGRVKESLICSVLRKGVLDIPLLFLLNGLLPMYGCTMVQPIVDCVSMLAALWLYRRILRQEGRGR